MTALLLMVSPVVAQETELGSPGITPDSSFYFLDRIFDGFQTAESRADEKAAETLAMAREGKAEHAERSIELYERAVNKLEEKSQDSEDVAEDVANRTTTHLIVLAGVLEEVPEEAKVAIERALEVSTRGREESVNALREMNPSRGEQVASQTLQRVMSETPAEAQEGLQTAFRNIGSRDSEAIVESGRGAQGQDQTVPETPGEEQDQTSPETGEQPETGGQETSGSGLY